MTPDQAAQIIDLLDDIYLILKMTFAMLAGAYLSSMLVPHVWRRK